MKLSKQSKTQNVLCVFTFFVIEHALGLCQLFAFCKKSKQQSIAVWISSF